MKVRCIQTSPTSEQREEFSINRVGFSTTDVTVGKEYIVLGLSVITMRNGPFGLGTLLEIIDDQDSWALAPMYMFEVSDPRPSRYWTIKKDSDNTIALLPESFHQPFYADQLTDLVPEIVADFKRVRALLESEFAVENDATHLD